jgi:pimeloyl-ACP methyl ester carboxylesterase
MLDGAGHWIQQERPAEVNAAVLEFLRSDAVRAVL